MFRQTITITSLSKIATQNLNLHLIFNNWHKLTCSPSMMLLSMCSTEMVDESRRRVFVAVIHWRVCLLSIADLLNMRFTCVSKSIGIAIPRALAISWKDNSSFPNELCVWEYTYAAHIPISLNVRMQFSTLNLCDAVSHSHWASLCAPWSNFTKIGCRVYISSGEEVHGLYIYLSIVKLCLRNNG